MKFHSLRLSALLVAGAALLCLPVHHASALEMRPWLKIDGTMFDAIFVRQVGEKIQLSDKDGRPVELLRSQLSFGDLDYIAENAPPDKTIKTLGSTGPKPKLPVPAKETKLDRRLFKKEAGDFKINNRTYRICETPHFKIMYLKPADPMDLAELAERLWVEHAFFHSTYIPKWHDRKMAVILVNDQEAYEDIGSWYADMIAAAGDDKAKDNAATLRATWPRTSGGTVNMPAAQADEQKVFSRIRVFRTYVERRYTDGSVKKEPVKGVWDSFRTHCLSENLLETHASADGVSKEGSFPIFIGHAYYKEIQLTGKSETGMVQAQGTDKSVGTTGGFQSDKDWAGELKKLLRKKEGKWKPNLDELWLVKTNGAGQHDMVFAYAFSRFLQSTPERLTAYNKLCQKIDTANQVPDIEEIATIYGYENGEAFKKAWVAYMESPEFK